MHKKGLDWASPSVDGNLHRMNQGCIMFLDSPGGTGQDRTGEFIKSVVEEYEVVNRGRDYHGFSSREEGKGGEKFWEVNQDF